MKLAGMRTLSAIALLILLAAGANAAGNDGTSASSERATAGSGAEKFEFQAEVNRLMDILVNSLYSNKDVFLRELISNSADALDKVRLLSLTDKTQLEGAEDLEIRVSLDHEKGVLKIRDTGIGMTKQDLIDNLGTIAKSGTSAFLENLQKGGDVNLIGQFGVGFYSIFLVADRVEVSSKHKDDVQWLWESKADGQFTIRQDDSEELGRGTQINIYLKEETQEYAAEPKLRELIGKYSEFINFPIYLYDSKEIEVPVEEAEEASKENAEESADIEDEEEEKQEEPKTEKKTVWDWELLNDNKPIWLRASSEVTDEEYNKFFKALTKTSEDPLAHIHFKGEGDVEFRSILFIPQRPPPGLLDNYYNQKTGLDLYVRRVFITNNFDELIPRYLGFLRGLVDSDTLPLSVSREVLQENASLKVIKKKITRKALDALKHLADEDEGDDDSATSSTGKYTKFWKAFGKLIKLGVIEDSANRQRLAKLIRFHTSKSTDKLVSFEEYVERMKKEQKKIYYFIGDASYAELAASPYLEKLLAKDYEVIFLTDSMDEYLMQHLTAFEDVDLQNAAKEKLDLGGKDDKEKKKEKALREEFKPLVKWWKGLLGNDVTQVRVSRRLAKTPAIVVVGQYGFSANLEKVMKSQALSDSPHLDMMSRNKDRVLEVNPKHPLVEELRNRFEKDDDDQQTKNMAHIIYESALLESGYALPSPKEFNARIYEVLAQSLKTKADFTKGSDFAEDEDDEVVEEEEEELAVNNAEAADIADELQIGGDAKEEL